MRLILAILLAAAVGYARADSGLSYAAFLGKHEVKHMVLSPDGGSIAYISYGKYFKNSIIYVVDLQTGKSHGIAEGFYNVRWVGPRRLLGITWYGYVAEDADGGHTARLETSNYLIGSMLHLFKEGPDGEARALFQNDAFPDEKMGINKNGYSRPDVVEVNVHSGKYHVVLENPGEVISWMADGSGRILAGRTLDRNGWLGVVYRPSESVPWRPVPHFRYQPAECRVLGLSTRGDSIFISAESAPGVVTLYVCDPLTGKLTDKLLTIKQGDFDELVRAPDHRVIGVRFTDTASRTFWLDAGYGRIQQAMDQRLPGRRNGFINSSDDEMKLLFLSETDDSPGTYYLLNLKDQSLAKLVDYNPELPAGLHSDTLTINIPARDGLKLPAYLTLPSGVARKNLPLIVSIHDDPWGRVSAGYDAETQFLTQRGYAVLRVNYRGALGYGAAFFRAGFGQLGAGMLNDIEDATRAALSSGMFDSHRVAIMGGGFGGYAVYMSLARTPGLYRCGVAMAAIVDWKEVVAPYNPENPYVETYDMARVQIGDPKKSPELFDFMSPLKQAAKIRTPMLIAVDSSYYALNKKMAGLIEENGVHVDYFSVGSRTPFGTDEGAVKLYDHLAAYLDDQLKR